MRPSRTLIAASLPFLASPRTACKAFAPSPARRAHAPPGRLVGPHRAADAFGARNSLPGRRSTRAAASEDGSEEREEEDADGGTTPSPGKIEEREGPSLASRASSAAFLLFSYCIQFLGAFFFCGFILNLLGFGYTVDLERGLVIDRMENIRNEVQFEREIEREEREGLRGSAASKYIVAPRVLGGEAASAGDR